LVESVGSNVWSFKSKRFVTLIVLPEILVIDAIVVGEETTV
jgi:hypothetical protein